LTENIEVWNNRSMEINCAICRRTLSVVNFE